MEEESLLLWHGYRAYDWHWEGWKLLKASPDMQEYSFMEVLTKTEAEELHDALTSEGWELSAVGSGWMNNISIYRRGKN